MEITTECEPIAYKWWPHSINMNRNISENRKTSQLQGTKQKKQRYKFAWCVITLASTL